MRRNSLLLGLTFFASGFPALLYQLVWQRKLFTIYGVNIESITVVVAAFMLGLGLGSLAGGGLARRLGGMALLVFAAVEAGIGAFGLVSLELFEWIGHATLGAPVWQVGVLTFAMVVLPTVLMGATLPLLVEHLVAQWRNVGASVGLLYFVNTLGSATACFVAALWLFDAWGMSTTVHAAGLINFLVAGGAATAYVLNRRARAATAGSTPPLAAEAAEGDTGPLLGFGVALALAAAAGFVSLSYEIIWSRVHSLVTKGAAWAFPLMLGAYLFGLAFGSLASGVYCRSRWARGPDRVLYLGVFVAVANLVGFAVTPLSGLVATKFSYGFLLPVVAVGASFLGAIFPLVSHLSVSPTDGAGTRVSFLYLANIAGAVAGSLLTGFVAMDHLSTATLSTLLGAVGMAAATVLVALEAGGQRRRVGIAVGVAMALLVGLVGPVLHGRLLERLHRRRAFNARVRFPTVIETKSGVIALSDKGVVYGGAVYDGAVNTSLMHDKNGIVRPYAVAALHPAPREVLEIGLSTGSWAQVLANMPGVERLTSIEINPGYLELISTEPEVQSLLHNPKVSVELDDGRRWLLRHPERTFDFVVMNTTFHWRAHASGLLSEEFLRLALSRLKPGGLILYNTTNSSRVQRTGATICPYAMRFFGFLLCSNDPIVFDAERWRTALMAWQIDGHPVVNPDEAADRERLEEVLKVTQGPPSPFPEGHPYFNVLETKEQILARTEGAETVTDDNMGTEFERINW